MREHVFVDIDTQVDFIDPKGKLYVPGAERIVPTLERLVEFARKEEITLLSSVDAHTPDDPEFEIFPPHCVRGTPGQAKIPQTLHARPKIVPNREETLDVEIHPGDQIILEKQTFSLFGNVHAEEILEKLGARHFVVFGVATDYCVKAAALGLAERGYDVTLVTDAIAAVSEEGGAEALERMKEAGIDFQCADAVIRSLSRH